MKARFCVLLLPVALGCAGAAEPKERPRLTPPVVSEVKQKAAQPSLDAGSASSFRSFDDFLQAGARRPVGLEAFREPPAAPSVAAGTGKTGSASSGLRFTSSPADPDILVLPKMEINAERMTKLKAQLAALEAQQAWWEKSAEAWETRSEAGLALDAILNPPFLKLGSYTGSGRAAIARQRVEMARWVKILEISLEEAKTPADKVRIQADIDLLNDITRHWE